jgi:hypothetical protein
MKGQRVSPAHRCARGDRPNLFQRLRGDCAASLMTAKSTTCLSTPLLMPNGERLRPRRASLAGAASQRIKNAVPVMMRPATASAEPKAQ